jgi:hypothetical protein
VKLSTTQLDTLARMGSGELERLPGGFWCTAATPRDYRGCPVWWCDIRTVRALERLGLIERCNVFPEEWRDPRKLKTA